MRNFTIAALAIIAVSFATTNKAEARSRVRFSFGHGGINVAVGGTSHHDDHNNTYNNRYGHNNRVVYNNNPYRSRYNGHHNTRYIAPQLRYTPTHNFHDTSHYDYTPARVNRHNNHYDFTPARTNLHRTGHVDHN